MTGNVVARRYAKALFAVGQKSGGEALDAFGKELSALAGVLDGSPEAFSFFKNPAFSAEEKKSVLKKLAEKVAVGQMMQNFCDLLADKDRVDVLPCIAEDFQSMLDQENGVIAGSLVTAFELSDGRKKELTDKLEKQTGKKLDLDFATDADILGGVVLKVGDKVLDASLRAQLDILKEQIKRGE
ncbi:F0F1 ATP synthase subunit delta [Paucidesulfovibrio longus]|uniref:F0F1 ATP synthase subunit delta n=1 Tax=Paucidesulfovibrio longus TaxID=889 RepID=UPI0003B68D96|nr:F0F1 ATP synthase subunit delta [Paucidesulfovibrio longus]